MQITVHTFNEVPQQHEVAGHLISEQCLLLLDDEGLVLHGFPLNSVDHWDVVHEPVTPVAPWA